ncbi:phosphopantetheine-binding protein, partial [Streptomyces lucensis]|uniref:phosphopantetheine-binding protein n=1 Tax=Streptomyces lucensis TaxID=67319 RepID=UPI00167ABF85
HDPTTTHTPHIPPRTEVEAELAEIWEKVLEQPRIGVLDDFFLLGGHSLLATTVIAEIRGRFGVSVPVRRLFETTTIADLAADLEERIGDPADTEEHDEISALVDELEQLMGDRAEDLSDGPQPPSGKPSNPSAAPNE